MRELQSKQLIFKVSANPKLDEGYEKKLMVSAEK